MTSTNKAARQQLEPATGPSRKTSTELAGGDGRMSHPTQEQTTTREPVSIGDALPEVLREIERRRAE